MPHYLCDYKEERMCFKASQLSILPGFSIEELCVSVGDTAFFVSLTMMVITAQCFYFA